MLKHICRIYICDGANPLARLCEVIHEWERRGGARGPVTPPEAIPRVPPCHPEALRPSGIKPEAGRPVAFANGDATRALCGGPGAPGATNPERNGELRAAAFVVSSHLVAPRD